MVTQRANALIAVFAGYIVENHPVWHAPRGVLRIGERIDIDHGRPNRGSDMDRAGVIRQQ